MELPGKVRQCLHLEPLCGTLNLSMPFVCDLSHPTDFSQTFKGTQMGLNQMLRVLQFKFQPLYTYQSIFRGETGDMFHVPTGSNLFQGKETVMSRMIQKRATILRPWLAFIKLVKVSGHLSSQFFCHHGSYLSLYNLKLCPLFVLWNKRSNKPPTFIFPFVTTSYVWYIALCCAMMSHWAFRLFVDYKLFSVLHAEV